MAINNNFIPKAQINMKPKKLSFRSQRKQQTNYQYVEKKKEDFYHDLETEFYLKEKQETQQAKNQLRKLSQCVFDAAQDDDKRMMTEMEDPRSWKINSYSIVCNGLIRIKSDCQKIDFRRNNTLGTMRNKQALRETTKDKKQTLKIRISSTSKDINSFKQNLKCPLPHETLDHLIHSTPLSKHCSIRDQYEARSSTISIKKKSNDINEKNQKETFCDLNQKKKKMTPPISFVMTFVNSKTQKPSKLKFQRSQTVHSEEQEKLNISKKFYVQKPNNTKTSKKPNKLSVFGICKQKNENKCFHYSNTAMKQNCGHSSTPKIFPKQNEDEHRIMRLRNKFEKLRKWLKKQQKSVHNIDDIPIKICQLKI